MSFENSASYKSAKYLCLFFIFCAIGSFIYCLVTRKYNGDFLGMPVQLPTFLLIINLFFSVLPFVLTWYLYKYLKRHPLKRRVSIPLGFLGNFLILLIFWNIVITLVYGVGIMAAPPYDAPPIIKPFIQIMNRFNYMYGVLLYFLASPKKSRLQIVLIILLIILCFLRAGLGVLLYLAMFSLIKYFDDILRCFKRQKMLIIIIFLLFPVIANSLYNLRTVARGQELVEEEFNANHLLFGKLLGRLSSFSDSAIILQEPLYFFIGAQQLDEFYFQKQALAGVFSLEMMPTPRPEQTLFWLYGPESEKNVSYMPGTQGNMYFSLLKSGKVLVMNIVTIGLMIWATFYFCRLLKFQYNTEFAFTLLLYVLLSGVPNEYSFLAFSILVYVILFLIINVFSIKSKPQPCL